MTGERFGRIAAAPTYLRVAEAIEREILIGRIPLGEHIGTEAELAEQFGVNRSTVREGIRLLEQSGLLRRDQSRRLFASVPRNARIASRISRALILHQTTFGEVWEASLALEPAIVEAATLRIATGDLDELESNVEQMAQDLDSFDLFADVDTAFHGFLAKACQNRVLQLAQEPARLLFSPTLKLILERVPAAARRNLEAHRRIVDAMRRRDAETARTWMHKHMVDWRRGFEQAGLSMDEPINRDFIEQMPLGNTYTR